MRKQSLIITAIATLAIATALIGSTYVIGQQLASAVSMNYTGNKTGMSGNSTAPSPGKISSRSLTPHCPPDC